RRDRDRRRGGLRGGRATARAGAGDRGVQPEARSGPADRAERAGLRDRASRRNPPGDGGDGGMKDAGRTLEWIRPLQATLLGVQEKAERMSVKARTEKILPSTAASFVYRIKRE